jgi:hypothetical protein
VFRSALAAGVLRNDPGAVPLGVGLGVSDADATGWNPSGPNGADFQGLLAVALPCNFSGVALEVGGLAVYLTPLDDHTRSAADAMLKRYLRR